MPVLETSSAGTVDEKKEEESPVPVTNLRNTYFAAVSALLYLVVLGMVSSYSAPATVDMKEPGSRFRGITADEITWIASLPLISGIFGNCFSGYATQKLGRKAVMMLLSTSYVVSWLIIAYAPSVAMVFVGRVICGLCAGTSVVTVPTYVVEIAPTEIRGLLSAGIQVAWGVGMLIVMTLGMTLRWSWLAVSGAAVAACASCLMVLMPESPSWLVRESRTAEAVESLEFLRGKKFDTKKELQEISGSLSQQPTENFKLRDFLDPTFYKPLALSIALMVFFQFSGFNVIMSYTVDIFQSSGSSIKPQVASTIVAGVQVVGTVLCSLLMDRSGRRRLYLTSGIFVTISLLALGLYSFMSTKYNVDVHSYGWIPLVCLVVYIFSFTLGLAPIPFVITPEISPLHSRTTIMAIATLALSLFGFLITKLYDNMVSALGLYGLFWTFGFFSFSSIAFGYFFLPETKGLSLNEIQQSLSSKSSKV